MGAFSGPNIVTNGLILDLDIANRKSYMRSGGAPLIDTSSWAAGQTSSVGYYSANQSIATENARVLDTDPWGNSSVVWETRASGDGVQDGGWNTSWFNADRTKTYRFSVWVRRTSTTSGGTFYFGLQTNGTNSTVLLNNTTQANPYWDYRGVGALIQNQWYLVTGHIFPAGYTGTTAHPDSGFYTIAGGTTKVASNAGNVPGDVKFPTDATQVYHRTYHFYDAVDSTTRLQFADPRIDMVDGTEPSIYELLNNGVTIIKDNSGRGNHHKLSNGYIASTNAPRKFTTNGTTDNIYLSSALAGATSTCTVVLWYSTSEIQELWVRGNSTSYFVSASNNNNYYHGVAGTPTNYVDLVAVTNPYAAGYKNNAYHMWEAKGVDFSTWTQFNWCYYDSSLWGLGGNVSKIMVYDRSLSAAESQQNFNALRGRYGL